MIIERYVAHSSPGKPQTALTNFFFSYRLLLLLFPVPWFVFAAYSLFDGPRSTRVLLFFASTLILGILALSTLVAIAFAMPWIVIIGHT